MAKVPSPFLTGATGKFAGAAFQQSPGNGTILREVVKPTNPSTQAQVWQRAKFKLMSQVASVFKSVIAMKREGNITPRNMFIKLNSWLLQINTGEEGAFINLSQLQLTKSAQAVSMEASFDAETGSANATLNASMPILYGAVFVHVSQQDQKPYIKAVARKTEEAAVASISHSFSNAAAGDVILAYGITQDTSSLAVEYGDLEATEGDAWLYYASKLAESSSLTQTVGADIEV